MASEFLNKSPRYQYRDASRGYESRLTSFCDAPNRDASGIEQVYRPEISHTRLMQCVISSRGRNGGGWAFIFIDFGNGIPAFVGAVLLLQTFSGTGAEFLEDGTTPNPEPFKPFIYEFSDYTTPAGQTFGIGQRVNGECRVYVGINDSDIRDGYDCHVTAHDMINPYGSEGY